MRFSISFSELFIGVVVLGGIGVAAWQALSRSEPTSAASTPTIKVPTLSVQATAGKHAFDANCAQCHGANGSGTDKGPPLINDIYNPGHHPDDAFVYATRQGVRQHHWPFGDMPAQPQVSDAQVGDIVRYVRELQQANGIGYRQHQM